MKKLFPLFLMMIFLISSCNEKVQFDPENNPGITLELKEVSARSVVFQISPVKADSCAWLCQTSDKAIPTSDYVMQYGLKADPSASSEVSVEDLVPETKYVIYAAAAGNGTTVISEPLHVVTAEDFDGIIADNLIEATYRDDNTAGNGNYTITISTGSVDESWTPVEVGGVVMMMDLFAQPDQDPLNAVLPDGVYRAGGDYAPFTFVPNYTGYHERTSADLVSSAFVDGTITVSHEGNDYTILAEVVSLDGVKKVIRYRGPINFVQTGTASFDRFDKDQDVHFESTGGRYWANWYNPHCDDLVIEFYNGEFDENGNLLDGYYMYMPLFMKKQEHPENCRDFVPITEGRYTVLQNTPQSLLYIPMTVRKGEEVEIFAEKILQGTYLVKMEKKTGKRTLGLIVDGSMDLKCEGEVFTLTFDFITEEGVKITGGYNGEIHLDNKVDNSEAPQRPFSTMNEDHVLAFPEDVDAYAYYLGEYMYPGLSSWILTVFSEKTPGDLVSLEFFTPAENGFSLDPCQLTLSREFQAYSMLPGFITYGEESVVFCWYADSSKSDDEGYTELMAPMENGTLQILKEGEEYRLIFDVEDDKGLSITGEWNGSLQLIDYTQQQAPAVRGLMRY